MPESGNILTDEYAPKSQGSIRVEEDENSAIVRLYDNCASIVNNPKRMERVQQWKEELSIYFNAQWTTEESDDMEATGQVDVVINVLRRSVRTLLSQMCSASPTAKLMPRDVLPANEDHAQIAAVLEQLQGLFDHTWYISGGKILLRRAIAHQLICGIGYIGVHIDPRADYWRGEVMFKSRLPWEKVIPLNANSFDFNDTAVQYYRRIVTLDQVARIIKDTDTLDFVRRHAIVMQDGTDYDVSMRGPDQSEVYSTTIKESGVNSANKPDVDLLVDWVEVEEKVDIPGFLYKIERADGVIDTVIVDPNFKGGSDGEKEVRELYRDTPAKVTKKEIALERIKQTVLCGRNVQISSEILPTSWFSDVPIIDEDSWNPLSYGEVFFVAPIQRLLNKVFSLATLHMQTSGSGDRIIGKKGTFGSTAAEVESFQRNYAFPSSITELADDDIDMQSDIRSKLMHIPATPLQPAVVQMTQMIISFIDRMMGIDPMSWGSSQGAPRTLGATLSLKEWGDESKAIPNVNLEYSLQRLGNVWLDRALHHYTFAKEFGVPDSHGRLRQYTVNRPVSGSMIENEIADVKANIFITHGSSLMVNRISTMMLFRELMPLHPVFMKMFLLYSDIPEKFDLMQEIDYSGQMQQQMEQLIPQLEQLQTEVSKRDQTIMDLTQKVEITKLKSTIDGVQTKYREFLKYQKQLIDMTTQDIRSKSKSNNRDTD